MRQWDNNPLAAPASNALALRPTRTLEEVLAAHPLPFELEQLQKEDILKLAGWRRALADLPVGYGKTVIATCVALMLQPALTIVLVPPILIVQWVRWLESIPNVGKVVAYTGSPAVRAQLPVNEADWLVMSYGTFRNDLATLLELTDGAQIFTIVDEAQAVKNYNSKLYDGVKLISEGKDLLLMTGTPMSKPGDAYAYIKLNTPEIYRTYQQFLNIHVARYDFFDQPEEWCQLDLLNANLSRRRAHRTKEEVHSALPKVRYTPVYYDLDKEHKALYKKLMEEQLLEVPEGKIDATTASKLYHNAQQIITDWAHFAGDSTKRSKVFEILETITDEINLGAPEASKLILWTIHKSVSALVLDYMLEKRENVLAANARKKKKAEHLVDPGHTVAAYSGANSKASVASFLDDPETKTLVAQPGSAGAGLNPQHLCWNCAFFEIPTTTIPFIQAAGRIDRKGQRYNPNVFLFIARGTIQELLLANLFANDKLVSDIAGTKQSLRNLIFPS